jgi:hypothetical protein
MRFFTTVSLHERSILMSDQRITIEYEAQESGPADLLGARLARIVEPALFGDVWRDDIVALTHLPGEAEGLPRIEQVLWSRHPYRTDLTYPPSCDAALSVFRFLLKGLGADFMIPISAANEKGGMLVVAHDEGLDAVKLAEAIGLPVKELVSTAANLDEEEGGEGTQGGDLLDFDQYFKKEVFIPLFIWTDGEVRPFQGYCRGNGPIGSEAEWEQSIGVFTAEGRYFAVVIDTRVRCATPQFFIDGKAIDFPIVSFSTMMGSVDPETGILNVAPQKGSEEPGGSATHAAVPDSMPTETEKQHEQSSGPNEP